MALFDPGPRANGFSRVMWLGEPQERSNQAVVYIGLPGISVLVPNSPTLYTLWSKNGSVSLFQYKMSLKGESFPIQDEPEGGGSFQYKMSLEQVAC